MRTARVFTWGRSSERDLRNKIAMSLGREKEAKAAAKGTKARQAGSYANRDPGRRSPL